MSWRRHTVLLAFEEAIGFALGAVGKDKDGIAAAAAFAELAAAVYEGGGTLRQHWAQLQAKYGRWCYPRRRHYPQLGGAICHQVVFSF